MKPNLLDAIKDKVLLGDGAMGTQLQQAGLEPGDCGEAWNLIERDKVLDIHKRYVDAGSDCLLANSFGANAITLKVHDLKHKCYDINKAAAEIAREAIGDDGYVLGDIGPFGGFLEPFGPFKEAQLIEGFKPQAQGLLDGGVDGFILETMSAVDEATAIVKAIREVGGNTIIVSFSFEEAGHGYRTMMGIGPEHVACALAEVDIDMLATNCGRDIEITDCCEILRAYSSKTDRPLMAKPNGGQPEWVMEQFVYHETPDSMAEHIAELVKSGARIIGGCCGTNAEHIARFREEIDLINNR